LRPKKHLVIDVEFSDNEWYEWDCCCGIFLLFCLLLPPSIPFPSNHFPPFDAQWGQSSIATTTIVRQPSTTTTASEFVAVIHRLFPKSSSGDGTVFPTKFGVWQSWFFYNWQQPINAVVASSNGGHGTPAATTVVAATVGTSTTTATSIEACRCHDGNKRSTAR
jgi:hypothetical protein